MNDVYRACQARDRKYVVGVGQDGTSNIPIERMHPLPSPTLWGKGSFFDCAYLKLESPNTMSRDRFWANKFRNPTLQFVLELINFSVTNMLKRPIRI
jgi:hypothetical protein